MKHREPHCPNCNVQMEPQGEMPIDLAIASVVGELYVCPNPDELCGYFTIFGEKVRPLVEESEAAEPEYEYGEMQPAALGQPVGAAQPTDEENLAGTLGVDEPEVEPGLLPGEIVEGVSAEPVPDEPVRD